MNRPVLLLGFIPRVIVPIARSLLRHGVPVDVASFPGAPRILSAAIHDRRTIPRPDQDRPEFLRQLRGFIAERGHDMLIPTDDWMLTALSEHYDDLADRVHIACPPPVITRLVLDKTDTLRIAQSCGIPVPRTVLISKSQELRELTGELQFPWVIKPARRETRTEEVKAYILKTPDEIKSRFPTPRDFAPALLVQPYCAGAGVGVEILLHEGKCIAAFQHRRLKEFPYTGGFSVTAIAEPVNPRLLEQSLALLRAIGWDGIAMVEYKVDVDGRAVLMEVNGRYWGTISLPILAGLDFPLYHWQLIHGERPHIPTTYGAGTKWRWTAGYLERLYNLVAKARSSARAREVLYQDIRQLREDFNPSVIDAMSYPSDPMPSFAELLQTIRFYAAYTAERAFRRALSSIPTVQSALGLASERRYGTTE